MEYKKPKRRAQPHTFTFIGEEIDAVQAAYTEDINNRIRKGNDNSISEKDEHIVLLDKHAPNLVIETHVPKAMLSIMEKFIDSTESRVRDLASREDIADHQNYAAVDRRRLGRIATDLVVEIIEKVEAFHHLPDEGIDSAEIEEQVEEFRQDLDNWPNRQEP